MLQERIQELIEQHGSLRAAARVLEVDPGYLSRLASGEKDDPGETLLRRMGLRRVVSYELRSATTAPLQEAMEKNDARYRWLRDQVRIFSLDMGSNHSYSFGMAVAKLRGPTFDAAIDAAIAATSKGKEQ